MMSKLNCDRRATWCPPHSVTAAPIEPPFVLQKRLRAAAVISLPVNGGAVNPAVLRVLVRWWDREEDGGDQSSSKRNASPPLRFHSRWLTALMLTLAISSETCRTVQCDRIQGALAVRRPVPRPSMFDASRLLLLTAAEPSGSCSDTVRGRWARHSSRRCVSAHCKFHIRARAGRRRSKRVGLWYAITSPNKWPQCERTLILEVWIHRHCVIVAKLWLIFIFAPISLSVNRLWLFSLFKRTSTIHASNDNEKLRRSLSVLLAWIRVRLAGLSWSQNVPRPGCGPVWPLSDLTHFNCVVLTKCCHDVSSSSLSKSDVTARAKRPHSKSLPPNVDCVLVHPQHWRVKVLNEARQTLHALQRWEFYW